MLGSNGIWAAEVRCYLAPSDSKISTTMPNEFSGATDALRMSATLGGAIATGPSRLYLLYQVRCTDIILPLGLLLSLPLPSSTGPLTQSERSTLQTTLFRPNKFTSIGSYVPSYLLPAAGLMAGTAYRLAPYNTQRANLYALASACILAIPVWSVSVMWPTNKELEKTLQDEKRESTSSLRTRNTS